LFGGVDDFRFQTLGRCRFEHPEGRRLSILCVWMGRHIFGNLADRLALMLVDDGAKASRCSNGRCIVGLRTTESESGGEKHRQHDQQGSSSGFRHVRGSKSGHFQSL
jgi:hypothetical protein